MVAGELRINWPELIAFKRAFTDPVPQKQEAYYAAQGIDAFHGLARFTEPDAVTVAGQKLKARHILIATGARPVPLRIDGAEHIITSDRFLELESLPSRIVLIGGGYIAAEFSHIAARAGAQVTVLQRCDRMLPHLDGAHIVGPHAEEVINVFALAIRHNLTARDLPTTMFAYPTGASDLGYMV